jgi:plasmid stabilization system protein ParE
VKIINLPAADREFAKVVAHYYKDKRPRRAARFIGEIDRASALLADNPYLGTPEDGEVRGVRARPLSLYHPLRDQAGPDRRGGDLAPEPSARLLAQSAEVSGTMR